MVAKPNFHSSASTIHAIFLFINGLSESRLSSESRTQHCYWPTKKEREKREGHEEGGGEGDTFFMATRLVMKHTIHKPHTMELFQKDF